MEGLPNSQIEAPIALTNKHDIHTYLQIMYVIQSLYLTQSIVNCVPKCMFPRKTEKMDVPYFPRIRHV